MMSFNLSSLFFPFSRACASLYEFPSGTGFFIENIDAVICLSSIRRKWYEWITKDFQAHFSVPETSICITANYDMYRTENFRLINPHRPLRNIKRLIWRSKIVLTAQIESRCCRSLVRSAVENIQFYFMHKTQIVLPIEVCLRKKKKSVPSLRSVLSACTSVLDVVHRHRVCGSSLISCHCLILWLHYIAVGKTGWIKDEEIGYNVTRTTKIVYVTWVPGPTAPPNVSYIINN